MTSPLNNPLLMPVLVGLLTVPVIEAGESRRPLSWLEAQRLSAILLPMLELAVRKERDRRLTEPNAAPIRELTEEELVELVEASGWTGNKIAELMHQMTDFEHQVVASEMALQEEESREG